MDFYIQKVNIYYILGAFRVNITYGNLHINRIKIAARLSLATNISKKIYKNQKSREKHLTKSTFFIPIYERTNLRVVNLHKTNRDIL